MNNFLFKLKMEEKKENKKEIKKSKEITIQCRDGAITTYMMTIEENFPLMHKFLLDGGIFFDITKKRLNVMLDLVRAGSTYEQISKEDLDWFMKYNPSKSQVVCFRTRDGEVKTTEQTAKQIPILRAKIDWGESFVDYSSDGLNRILDRFVNPKWRNVTDEELELFEVRLDILGKSKSNTIKSIGKCNHGNDQLKCGVCRSINSGHGVIGFIDLNQYLCMHGVSESPCIQCQPIYHQ